MEKCRMVFSGSGGQGVITAAIIIAEAAVFHENLIAVQSQAYGAAARGGAARSDVIISDSAINYPKVIQPNVLICLTQEAYDKFFSIVRPGGLLLTDPRFVKTNPKSDAVQIELPVYKAVMDRIGKPIVFNICMLGAVISLIGILKPDSIMKVIETRVPSDLIGVNEEALKLGREMGEKHKR
jgi:2-oxoglutarate ferredoxin oxidoreductase subunit gamma